MIELLALDIAGTTIEDHQAVYVALGEAARAAGARPTPADIRTWMGSGKREALSAMLADVGIHDDTVADAAFADFRVRLDRAYTDVPPTPLPGVADALARLRADGVKVALTTGFDRDVTDRLLASVGWGVGANLDAVVTVDDVPAGRPAPYMIFRAMELTGVRSVAAVLTAGDTVRDLEAGTNAGAGMVVGVLSGGGVAEELTAAPHTHILGSVAELPSLLT